MRAEKKFVPKRQVWAVIYMYKKAKTWVQFRGGHLKEFDVGGDAYHRSVLSTFLFSIVLDVLSKDGRKKAL